MKLGTTMKYGVTFLLLAVTSLLVACSAQRYRDESAGYTMSVPKDWTFVSRNSGSVRLGAKSPPFQASHRAHVAVAVEPLAAPMNLETFTRRSFTIVTEELKDVQMRSSAADQLGGQEAQRVVYSFGDQGARMTLLSYFLVTEDKGFVLSCGAESEVFEQATNVCEEVLRSFELSR